MYFSGHFMTIFRSNYIHLNFFFLISILLFVKYMLMYLTFSNLNSIHWLIIKKKCTFQDIFRTFHDNFQVKLFPPKIIFFNFFLNIRYIYANVFKIFKFELNPLPALDNKKDIGLYVLFRIFHDNFQVKLFPLKKCFF